MTAAVIGPFLYGIFQLSQLNNGALKIKDTPIFNGTFSGMFYSIAILLISLLVIRLLLGSIMDNIDNNMECQLGEQIQDVIFVNEEGHQVRFTMLKSKSPLRKHLINAPDGSLHANLDNNVYEPFYVDVGGTMLHLIPKGRASAISSKKEK